MVSHNVEEIADGPFKVVILNLFCVIAAKDAILELQGSLDFLPSTIFQSYVYNNNNNNNSFI